MAHLLYFTVSVSSFHAKLDLLSPRPQTCISKHHKNSQSCSKREVFSPFSAQAWRQLSLQQPVLFDKHNVHSCLNVSFVMTPLFILFPSHCKITIIFKTHELLLNWRGSNAFWHTQIIILYWLKNPKEVLLTDLGLSKPTWLMNTQDLWSGDAANTTQFLWN